MDVQQKDTRGGRTSEQVTDVVLDVIERALASYPFRIFRPKRSVLIGWARNRERGHHFSLHVLAERNFAEVVFRDFRSFPFEDREAKERLRELNALWKRDYPDTATGVSMWYTMPNNGWTHPIAVVRFSLGAGGYLEEQECREKIDATLKFIRTHWSLPF